MNLLATIADVPTLSDVVLKAPQGVSRVCSDPGQRERIFEALWPLGEHGPGVDEETLSRYYKYLSARLTFPFAATYPEPRTALEEAECRCTVIESLDPAQTICDEFDGIRCRIRKGKYGADLPLTELEVPEDSANFQLIEDYWHWFWNWR